MRNKAGVRFRPTTVWTGAGPAPPAFASCSVLARCGRNLSAAAGGTAFANQGRGRPADDPHPLPQGGLRMFYDVSPGDVIFIGEAVTLTVVAVEDNLIRVRLELPRGRCPDAGPEGM